MNKIKYKERSLLGGWHIDVLREPFVLGTIRENPSNGAFAYYHGPHNILTASFEEQDLDALKKRIEALEK